jgi:hypothetical protein
MKGLSLKDYINIFLPDYKIIKQLSNLDNVDLHETLYSI